MRKTSALLAAITLTSVTSLASAGAYVGGNYAFIDIDDVDVGALVFKGGYKFNEWAAVEARAGFGIDDDSYYGVDVELDSLFGAYFVAGMPTTTGFYPYAIVGYSRGELEASGFGNSLSEDESGLSYGLGLDYNFTDFVAANVEVIRYLDEDDAEADAISLGLTYRF